MAHYEDATRRESMRIRYDYTHMLAEAVGERLGAGEAELD